MNSLLSDFGVPVGPYRRAQSVKRLFQLPLKVPHN